MPDDTVSSHQVEGNLFANEMLDRSMLVQTWARNWSLLALNTWETWRSDGVVDNWTCKRHFGNITLDYFFSTLGNGDVTSFIDGCNLGSLDFDMRHGVVGFVVFFTEYLYMFRPPQAGIFWCRTKMDFPNSASSCGKAHTLRVPTSSWRPSSCSSPSELMSAVAPLAVSVTEWCRHP